MKLKVIKAVKGLVPGDILDYNEKDSSYEIFKVEEDITESGSSKKSLKVTIPEYLVDDFKEFFTWVDDDGDKVTVEEFRYKDSPNYEPDMVEEVAKPSPVEVSEPISFAMYETLKQKISNLERQLEEYSSKQPINYPVYTIYPRRSSFYEPIFNW
jgi:hypothetical protein